MNRIEENKQIVEFMVEKAKQNPSGTFENIIANGTPLNEYCEQQCPCYPMESEDD